MEIPFTLVEPTTVQISFSTAVQNTNFSSSNGAIFTRIWVNNQTYAEAGFSSVARYLTLSNERMLQLPAGNHTVRIEFTDNHPGFYVTSLGTGDAHRTLQVLVYGE